VDSVYRSIDVNDVGFVNYSDFTNYLIASEAGLSFSSKIYISRLTPFIQQDDDSSVSVIHRDAIDCLCYVRKPCPMIISGGRDGMLAIWDPDSLSLMKNISHSNKNDIYREELKKSLSDSLALTKKNKKKGGKGNASGGAVSGKLVLPVSVAPIIASSSQGKRHAVDTLSFLFLFYVLFLFYCVLLCFFRK
jgi:WD40 repeat protein